MFKTYIDTSFYLYKYNFEKQRWEWIKNFTNEEELIAYIASKLTYTYHWYEDDRLHQSHLENRLYDTLNYTGKDFASIDGRFYFRHHIIFDGYNRIIDPRQFETKILATFYYTQAKKTRTYWRYNKIPSYIYCKDPVPHTGHHSGRYCRKVKHWFNSYRNDRITEYQTYVRKKAMVPNTWDSEPFQHFEKSWKRQTKCRRQWEKYLHHKK